MRNIRKRVSGLLESIRVVIGKTWSMQLPRFIIYKDIFLHDSKLDDASRGLLLSLLFIGA